MIKQALGATAPAGATGASWLAAYGELVSHGLAILVGLLSVAVLCLTLRGKIKRMRKERDDQRHDR